MRRRLSTDDLLRAYQTGWFPMAEPDGEIYWYEPKKRGIFELDGLKISRSLKQTLAKDIFEVRVDSQFTSVMEHCAMRDETWISKEIIRAYGILHATGLAHSVESWHNDTLVGGLYGVALGGAFFGESMFSTMRDASKVALVALVRHLNERGFALLDTQFITPHLKTMGAIEISKEEYLRRLDAALQLKCHFA